MTSTDVYKSRHSLYHRESQQKASSIALNTPPTPHAHPSVFSDAQPASSIPQTQYHTTTLEAPIFNSSAPFPSALHPSQSPFKVERKVPSTASAQMALSSFSNSPGRDQWLFDEEDLLHTPSIIHGGLTMQEEWMRRAKGVNFIIQAGMILKLPQLTLATASVFFHRFYMRESMVAEKGGIHHYTIAATALFLATKTEENCRKTKEIVIAVAKVAQKNASLIIDEQSKEFWRWKDAVLLYEETMLEKLTFDVVLGSPYERLYHILRDCGSEVIGKKTMRDAAWSFLNDSALTTLCLLQTPQEIAIAALYWAVNITNEHIPDFEDGTPWWKKYEAKKEKVSQAIDIMCRLYSENPLQKNANPYDRSPDSDEIDFEKTRGRARSGSEGYTPNGDSMRRTDSQQYDSPNGFQGTPGDAPKASNGNGNGNGNGDAMDVDTKREDGSSDVNLKAAANDPATHEKTANGNINGVQDRSANDVKREERSSDETMAGTDDASHSQSSKRKDNASSENLAAERDNKRARTEPEEMSGDQSEEGEVEE